MGRGHLISAEEHWSVLAPKGKIDRLSALRQTPYIHLPEIAASVFDIKEAGDVQMEAIMTQAILIADDSPNVRQAVHDYLTERNFHVCGEAVDGQDVIEKARELNPDLVLMDLAMPGTNGIVAASVLKGMMPSVRIVLFTMYSGAVNKAFTSLNDIDAMVDKAGGMGKLAECIQGLLSPSAETASD
jgi:CheY-like chemotaxis protein